MNALIALTLTSTLSAAPAAAPATSSPTTAPARATLAAQVDDLVKASSAVSRSRLEVTATRVARQPGDDSLANGAIIGGVVTGVGMGAFLYTLCRALDDTGGDANCAGPAVLWGAIFGAGGAAVGAGVDALFDQKQKALPGKPGKAFKIGVRF